MILIPAAGKSQRFRDAGYDQPKHLIPLCGKPMIQRVIENLLPLDPAGGVTVLTAEDVGETRGTAETIARSDLDSIGPLVIANCDQLIKLPPSLHFGDWDGIIFTFPSRNADHSYVETHGFVTAIIEKVPFTNRAVSGVYWFKSHSIIEYCRNLVRTDTENMYLSAAIDLMISDGYHFNAVDVDTAILGTPEDFQRFEVARCF